LTRRWKAARDHGAAVTMHIGHEANGGGDLAPIEQSDRRQRRFRDGDVIGRRCGPGLVHSDPNRKEHRGILPQPPAPLRIAPLPQQPTAQVVTARNVFELDVGFVQLRQNP
jgi:hypothetical protein